MVAASAGDIRLKATVEVISSIPYAPAAERSKLAAYYDFPKGVSVNQGDFEALLGRTLPPNQVPQKGAYDLNTPIMDMRDSFIARQLFNYMQRQMAKIIAGQEGTPTALMMETMLHEMPLRSLLMVADGSITREILVALLVMINGSFFKGLSTLVKAIRQKGK